MTLRSWRHCPSCAGPLTHHASPDQHVACAACGFRQYENPLPTTLLLPIDAAGRVLLVRRAQEPRSGHWDTLGGFLEVGETAEQGALRELHEEIGLSTDRLDYLGSFPSVYGDTGRRTLAISFACRLHRPAAAITLSDESTEHGWFALDALPELAFRDGDDAVRALLARGDLRTRSPSGD